MSSGNSSRRLPTPRTKSTATSSTGNSAATSVTFSSNRSSSAGTIESSPGSVCSTNALANSIFKIILPYLEFCDCSRPASQSTATSSSSNSADTSVTFSSDRSSSEKTIEPSAVSSDETHKPSPVSLHSTKSVGSAISLANSVYNVVAPDLEVQDGDVRHCYNLQDKGKLVVINRITGETVYMFRCVDGRRVFIEKALEGASLILTDQKGRVIKSMAGYY